MADQDALAAAVAQKEQEDTRNLMLRDRRAQGYYFGLERLNMAKELHDAQMQAQQGKLEAEKEMQPLRKQALEARIRAETALENARIAQQKNADDKATRIANGRTAFFNGITALRAKGLKPSDDEYKNGAMDLLVQYGDSLGNPEKKAFTDEIKATKPTDPIDASEQAIAGMAALKDAAKQKGMNVSTSWMMSPTGRASVRVNEIRPTAPPRPPSNPELTRLKSQLGQMEADQIAIRPEDSSATPEKQQESLFKQRSAMEPSMKLLREKIASMEAAQAPATAVPAAPASSQPVAPPIQPAPAGPTAALLGITPAAAPQQPPVPAQQPERPKLGDIFK